MPTPNGKQFQEHADQDGPRCPNCASDIEEVIDWNDRAHIHPSLRAACVGCGAV